MIKIARPTFENYLKVQTTDLYQCCLMSMKYENITGMTFETQNTETFCGGISRKKIIKKKMSRVRSEALVRVYPRKDLLTQSLTLDGPFSKRKFETSFDSLAFNILSRFGVRSILMCNEHAHYNIKLYVIAP